MAYGDDLATLLGSTNRYSFDGNVNDQIGSQNGTNSGGLLTGAPLCLGVTNSVTLNGTTDRITIPTTGSIDDSATSKGFCGWVELSAPQLPFCRMFGEGNSAQNASICIGSGNSVIFEADGGSFVAQVYGELNLAANRKYHVMWLWDSTGLRGYIDGSKQSLGQDFAQTSATIPARTPIEFGDPVGTVSLGGTAVVLVSPVSISYNEWQFFDPSGLTDLEIFDESFVNGSIAGVTITNQAGLDAIADTARTNEALNIRVDVAGSIDLIADNVTHSSLASAHVHYTGTGTLNWTNTNGSNASIGSAHQGTINFINPATLTINGLIDGCEIRIYDDDGVGVSDFGTELGGVESNAGATFDFDHDGVSNEIIVQMLANGYKEILRQFTLGAGDQGLTLLPEVEDN